MLHKILVPLDGSDLAESALTFATALSIPSAARLMLVRAANAHASASRWSTPGSVCALTESELYLHGMAATLEARGFSVEIAKPYGNWPAVWIIDESRLRGPT
jgi:nucleotide-binding universal stress UspA family protein